MQNGYQKNASDEAVKKSSSKSKNVDLKEESSGNIRNASKDRSHHRTKIRSHTKVEDSNNNNNNKEHKERKEIVQNDKDHKRVKEKSSRDNKDSKEKHNNKVERGSKEKHSRTKETPRELKKLVDDNKSSPQRVNINNSPKHFTERRHDEQLSNGVLDNKDVETLVLGSKELTNEKSQLQESSKASPPRRPPTARITTGRPSTTRPTTAQVANGDVLPSRMLTLLLAKILFNDLTLMLIRTISLLYLQ